MRFVYFLVVYEIQQINHVFFTFEVGPVCSLGQVLEVREQIVVFSSHSQVEQFPALKELFWDQLQIDITASKPTREQLDELTKNGPSSAGCSNSAVKSFFQGASDLYSMDVPFCLSDGKLLGLLRYEYLAEGVVPKVMVDTYMHNCKPSTLQYRIII